MNMAGKNDAVVAGIGMIPFSKPSQGERYDEMGAAAARLALADAGIAYTDVQQGYTGFVYGDTCSGNKTLYKVGLTRIPIFNVNSACSTASSALFLARQAIESGNADCVLVVGFEQMSPGALGTIFNDRPSVVEEFDRVADELVPSDLPLALRYFCGAGISHMDKFGTTIDDFASIRAKASRHAVRNPLSVFRQEMTVDEVLQAPAIWPNVMTRPMACPPTCGAAAAVLVSRAFARRRGLDERVSIQAQAMVTDGPSTFESGDMMRLVGYDMAAAAAKNVYETAGLGPNDISVVELHDCFAQNELITYESLGLCPEGGAQKFIADGDNTYGGKVVTNPSGGLLSKGHPLGATGLAQCYELVHQLRGTAGDRQVEGVRHALQHNFGLGGACVVTLYAAS
jgi:acetyl-CoA acetyltransferase